MSTLSVTALFTVVTAAEFLARGLTTARLIGLPVTSWTTGDPTRSLYKFLSEALAEREGTVATFIKAGFLSSAVADAKATGDSSWLKLLAFEQYGVTASEATYATPTVTLTNTGGGYYPIEAGDITFRSSVTGKTYRNTTAAIITPIGTTQVSATEGPVITFDAIADEAGSDSSVAEDEIDGLVTSLLGVNVTASSAATAVDEQTPDAIEEQCDASLGALSPNGPPDAYEYVCRNSELTGVTDITRAKTVDDSDTGDVIVYVAGPSGPVAGASITAAQTAVELWATPNCITPTVTNAIATTIAVTAEVSGEDIPADFEDVVSDELEALFAAQDIGGTIARSAIISKIHTTLATLGASDVSVDLTLPAANVALAANAVPVRGTVTLTEV